MTLQTLCILRQTTFSITNFSIVVFFALGSWARKEEASGVVCLKRKTSGPISPACIVSPCYKAEKRDFPFVFPAKFCYITTGRQRNLEQGGQVERFIKQWRKNEQK